ncbi:MAG: hypothetical protein K0U38_01560 [Epsilonproteobacteria bacterium]|nr:hypothetical protein [Campylobacterota bacterium]
MSYTTWFQSHSKQHQQIIKKLQHLSDNELIEYFQFENMVKNEPNFCPLYIENKKCHEMENLNCYLCACPNFRFDDAGFKAEEKRTLFSYCDIDSKDGGQFKTDDAIHQNCAGCLVPHHEAYIKKQFSRDWFSIMKDVQNA